MSAQPHEPPLLGIDRTPEAVRASLDAADQARFDQAWREALDEARGNPSLTGLQQVVGDFWAIASAKRSPNRVQAEDDERRWLAGENVGIPAEQVFAEVGITL